MSAISCCECLRCSGSTRATRMKPMCGPSFALVIALRAFSGDPSLVRTRVTSPFGSSRASIFAMSWIRAFASFSEMPGENRT